MTLTLSRFPSLFLYKRSDISSNGKTKASIQYILCMTRVRLSFQQEDHFTSFKTTFHYYFGAVALKREVSLQSISGENKAEIREKTRRMILSCTTNYLRTPHLYLVTTVFKFYLLEQLTSLQHKIHF